MLHVASLANTKWCKKLENDFNLGTWILILEYSARAIQWIPAWQGLDGFQKTVASALEGFTPDILSTISGLCNQFWDAI